MGSTHKRSYTYMDWSDHILGSSYSTISKFFFVLRLIVVGFNQQRMSGRTYLRCYPSQVISRHGPCLSTDNAARVSWILLWREKMHARALHVGKLRVTGLAISRPAWNFQIPE